MTKSYNNWFLLIVLYLVLTMETSILLDTHDVIQWNNCDAFFYITHQLRWTFGFPSPFLISFKYWSTDPQGDLNFGRAIPPLTHNFLKNWSDMNRYLITALANIVYAKDKLMNNYFLRFNNLYKGCNYFFGQKGV